MTDQTHVSVIGLGNVFLGDDGFGPLAAEIFRCEYECGSNVEVLDLGTPGLDLAPYLYGRNLIVIIDAVHSDAPVGAVSTFCEDDFASSNARLRVTGHDPGLWDTLTHLRLAGHAPSELIIVGVNPESCRFAEPFSEQILKSASETAATVAGLLCQRGAACRRRSAAITPNLWWLPISYPHLLREHER
jgi:hydrogenase maturation protease